MEKKRVVVTGIGALTPYGIGVENFWNNIKNGVSGITEVKPPRLDIEGHNTHVFGVVPEYDATLYMDAKEVKRLDPFIKHALVAGEEAFKQSGIDMSKEDPYRAGCMVTAAAGGHHTIQESHKVMLERHNYTKCSPFTVPENMD